MQDAEDKNRNCIIRKLSKKCGKWFLGCCEEACLKVFTVFQDLILDEIEHLDFHLHNQGTLKVSLSLCLSTETQHSFNSSF